MSEKIAVIGAGIAGLTVARMLADAGLDVTIFEKSGGTGGRLSTRRTEHGGFDHGAQYVAAKGDAFRALLTGLSNHGSVAYWEPKGKDRPNEWHVGLPGMSGLVKPLQAGLTLNLKTRISSIARESDDIVCSTETGEAAKFDRVICAIPSPQALELLEPVDDVFKELAQIVYGPCWSAMFAFEAEQSNLPEIYRGDHDSALGWLARNSSKPEREGACTYIVHGGGNWSRTNLEIEKDEAQEMLFDALQIQFGKLSSPVYSDAHRWRYAHVDTPLGVPFLANSDQNIFAIGDGMLGGRVEAAFESARQLASHLKGYS